MSRRHFTGTAEEIAKQIQKTREELRGTGKKITEIQSTKYGDQHEVRIEAK